MQREVRAAENGDFDPDQYMSPGSVAAVVNWIISAPRDTHVTEIVIKPTVAAT
jgi:NADP-dependent 3-hydroxy acid dehydrogenase YdfG